MLRGALRDDEKGGTTVIKEEKEASYLPPLPAATLGLSDVLYLQGKGVGC